MQGLVARHHHEWLAGDSGNPWAVEGLIDEGLTLLVAKRDVGKSLLTTDLAIAVVRGEETWLGRKVRPDFKGGVYFIVTDSRAEIETSRRLANLGAPEGSVIVARLPRGPAPAAEWRELGECMVKGGTRLVIVDSGTGLVHDINKPEFVNPLFDGLKELVTAGLSVLLVHHQGKNSQGAAGLYCWESEPRWELVMTKSGENYRVLTCEGNNITDEPMTMVIRMPRRDHSASRFSPADRGQGPEERTPEREAEDDMRLRRMIEGQPWGSQAEIGRALGIGQPTVSRVLRSKGFALNRETGLLEPVGDQAGVPG